jgi:hypothetical protein
MPYNQLTVMWSDLGFTFVSIHYDVPCVRDGTGITCTDSRNIN